MVDRAVVSLQSTTDILFQRCHFVTNMTVDGLKSAEINLRMSQSSFAVNTSDKDIKIIYFLDTLQVSWMLWKTEFQLNSHYVKSSDDNFTNYLDKIITINSRKTFLGTIWETQYASGNIA